MLWRNSRLSSLCNPKFSGRKLEHYGRLTPACYVQFGKIRRPVACDDEPTLILIMQEVHVLPYPRPTMGWPFKLVVRRLGGFGGEGGESRAGFLHGTSRITADRRY